MLDGYVASLLVIRAKRTDRRKNERENARVELFFTAHRDGYSLLHLAERFSAGGLHHTLLCMESLRP